ncbi:MAG: hypothetical protein HY659_14790 [Rhizobiales bacterium]|nr:hypothetical protein [Hyphomicrobiales bacterium]
MSKFENAWQEHQRRRWMRPDAYRWVRPDAYRFMSPDAPRYDGKDAVKYFWPEAETVEVSPHDNAEAAELQRELDAIRRDFEALKREWHARKYSPDQPRVPAGNPDGGQWTDNLRRTGSGDNSIDDADLVEGNDNDIGLTDVSAANVGHIEEPPLEDPPEIPPRRPPAASEVNDFLKAAARWVARAVRVGGPVQAFMAAYEAMSWLDTDRPFIEAYQDPPKSLEALQQAVSKTTTRGYQDHHIVEQASARDAEFPESMINGPQNLIRIPTLKHWEISAWFSRRNETFGGLSPRDYLRDKDWAERVRVGRESLIEHKVLKP